MGCVSVASKEELLQNINPDMRLTNNFFKQIYGYEISWLGFADQAIAALEAAECSHAREYYTDWVTAYETEHNAMMKRVAEWYSKQDFYRKDVRKSGKSKKRNCWSGKSGY